MKKAKTTRIAIWIQAATGSSSRFSRSVVGRSSVRSRRRSRTCAPRVGGMMHTVADAAESSESDIQDDIEFALIQLKARPEQDRRGAPAAGGRLLRLLLRVRGGDLRTASAGVALCGSLQGLRRATEVAAQRDALRHSVRSFVALPRRVELNRRPRPDGRHGPCRRRPWCPRRPFSRGGRFDERSTERLEQKALTRNAPEIPPELPILPLRDTVLFPIRSCRSPSRGRPRASDRRCDWGHEADRGVHAAGGVRRGAARRGPLPHRHRHAHSQDVQAARRQPAPHRPGDAAALPRPRDAAAPVPPGGDPGGRRDRARGGPPRGRRADAQHQEQLPAGGVAVAPAVGRPPVARDEHRRAGEAGRLHRLELSTIGTR